MSTMKRLLAWILVLTLCIGLFPIGVLADDEMSMPDQSENTTITPDIGDDAPDLPDDTTTPPDDSDDVMLMNDGDDDGDGDETAVASVETVDGTQYYTDILEAFDAANAADSATITLLDEIELADDQSIISSGNIVLVINENTGISGFVDTAALIYIRGGQLSITSDDGCGQIENTGENYDSAAIKLESGTLNIESDVSITAYFPLRIKDITSDISLVIDNGHFYGSEIGLSMYTGEYEYEAEYNISIEINDGYFSGYSFACVLSAFAFMNAVDITINGGTYCAEDGQALYISQPINSESPYPMNLTINGGSYSTYWGSEIDASYGNVAINGGDFTTTGPACDGVAALYLYAAYNEELEESPIQVEVSGGSFTGGVPLIIECNNEQSPYLLSGGTYTLPEKDAIASILALDYYNDYVENPARDFDSFVDGNSSIIAESGAVATASKYYSDDWCTQIVQINESCTIQSCAHEFDESDFCTICHRLNPNHVHQFDEEDYCTMCGRFNPNHIHDWSNNDGICKICGDECYHNTSDDDYNCTRCGMQDIAGFSVITSDGGKVFYDTFEEAFEAACGAIDRNKLDATLQMNEDATIDDCTYSWMYLDHSNSLTINLNGHTLESDLYAKLFNLYVDDEAESSLAYTLDVIVTGNGTINKPEGSSIFDIYNLSLTIEDGSYQSGGYGAIIDADYGDVTIQDGTFTGRFFSSNSSTLLIQDGTFSNDGDDYLIQGDCSDIEITQGDFTSSTTLLSLRDTALLINDGSFEIVAPSEEEIASDPIIQIANTQTFDKTLIIRDGTYKAGTNAILFRVWNQAADQSLYPDDTVEQSYESAILYIEGGTFECVHLSTDEADPLEGGSCVLYTTGDVIVSGGEFSGNVGISASGAALQVSGGSIDADIAIYATYADVNISNGAFSGTITALYAEQSTVKLTGGSFSAEMFPAIASNESGSMVDILESGYIYVDEDGTMITTGIGFDTTPGSRLDESMALTGPVTVVKHTPHTIVDGVCEVCGFPCQHENVVVNDEEDHSYRCTICDTIFYPIATVAVNGENTFFFDFSEALEFAMDADESTIQLMTDVDVSDITDTVGIANNLTIQLGDYQITGVAIDDDPFFVVTPGASLTIEANSSSDQNPADTMNGAWFAVDTATLMLNGGVYSNTGIEAVDSEITLNSVDLTFRNSVNYGNSIRTNNTNISISDCTITGSSNSVSPIIGENGTLTITGSTISGNAAIECGFDATDIQSSNISINNSTAMIWENGTLTIDDNSTISGNTFDLMIRGLECTISKNLPINNLRIDSTATVTIQTGTFGTISNSGNLTIKAGSYDQLRNYGTVVIDGGSFNQILNCGALTINDISIISNSSDGCIYQYQSEIAPSLTINGGSFTDSQHVSPLLKLLHGTATINGGTFTSNFYQAIYCIGATITINNGSFTCADGYAVCQSSGKVNIYGGTFTGKEYAVGAYSAVNLKLFGGTYNGLESATTVFDWLAADHAYMIDNSYVADQTVLDSKKLTGTVTVVACTHESVINRSNSSTCDTVCAACRKVMSSGEHSYSTYEIYTDQATMQSMHRRTCSVCGYSDSEAHSYNDDGICTTCGAQPPVITVQPENADFLGEDESFTFSVTADQAVSYQWVRRDKDSDSWRKLTNGTSATLTLPVEYNSVAYYYACLVTAADGSSVLSSVVRVNDGDILSYPNSVDYVATATGMEVTFTVDTKNAFIHYWSYSTDGGTKWNNASNISTWRTNSITVQYNADNIGTIYRCLIGKVSMNSGSFQTNYEYTDSVGINPQEILVQPQNTDAEAGDTVSFTVEAKNASEYQWYYRTSATGDWLVASGFNGAKTNTLQVYEYAHRLNYQFRCEIRGSAESIYTNTVGINPPEVLTNPVDADESEEGTIQFTAAGKNVISYQWQYSANAGESWSNLYNRTLYTGCQTNNLTVTLNDANRKYLYRCVIKGAAGATVTTEDAHLGAVSVATATGNADENGIDVSASGEIVTMTATAKNAAYYQWEYSADHGATWQNATFTGSKTKSMTVSMNTECMAWYYRCKVISCDQQTSANTNVLSLNALTITQQPVSVDFDGTVAVFTLEAKNAITYEWYYRTKSSAEWQLASSFRGYRTNTLSVDFYSHRLDYEFYCKVSGISTEDSEIVGFNPPVATGISADDEEDGIVYFHADAKNAKSNAYQWQTSADGENWTTLSNNKVNSGVTTADLKVILNDDIRENEYRYIATGANNATATSKAVHMNDVTTISCRMTSRDTTLTLTADAPNATAYKWQYLSGSTWTDCTADSTNRSTMALELNSQNASRTYRCIAYGFNGSTATSDEVKLEPLNVIAQPTRVDCEAGQYAEFTVDVENAISYQWYYRTSESGIWLPATPFIGSRTNTLRVYMYAHRLAYEFRCVVIGSTTVTTEIVGVKNVAITGQPTNADTENGSASFTVAAKNVTRYQWQYSSDNGISWTNLYNNSIYSGCQKSSLNVKVNATNKDYSYRCVITGAGTPVISDAVVINP